MSDDTVERVAKAILDEMCNGNLAWEQLQPERQEDYRNMARAAIAAMQKEAAMDRLVAEGQRCDAMTSHERAFVREFAMRAKSTEHDNDEQDLISRDSLLFQRDCDITTARVIVAGEERG